MKKVVKLSQLLIICLFASTFGFNQSAHAENIFSNHKLAYAAPDNFKKKPGLFDQFDNGAEEHELNDAWLGMPVKSKDGKLVGTVAYAFLDDNGDVSELLVELSASSLNYAVYVDGDKSELGESAVSVSMSKRQIAALEREEENSFAMKN